MPEPSRELNPQILQDFQADFAAEPKNRLALDAITLNPIHNIARSRQAVTGLDHTYSHVLASHEATSQENSGRCWMFAGLNFLRYRAMERLNLEKFELSQAYLMFWDKVERANYFLESILKTLDEPVNGRLVAYLLMDPLQDGGQWDMFINLVNKHGVVPKNVMPESESSSHSRWMDHLITTKLREDAAELHRLHAAGAGPEELRRCKIEMMAVIYRMVSIHLGQPPERFYWQWRDKDDQFHRDGEVTPQDFFRRYVDFDTRSMACLIHCPTADKPFNRLYTVDYLGNVVEGEIIRYLNVELPVFKQAAVDSLLAGTPVWFGCDVGKMLEPKQGVLDMGIYDYALAYGTDFKATKAERVDYGQSVMTHAMVFTGVDIDEAGRPRKWRVENSWGDKDADKGFLAMSDAWFDEYMYEVVVDKRFIPAELLPVLESEPVHLPPWDPMGALARAR